MYIHYDVRYLNFNTFLVRVRTYINICVGRTLTVKLCSDVESSSSSTNQWATPPGSNDAIRT